MRYLGFYIIIALAVIFIVFITFPNLSFYRHHINYKQFDIYSDIEINDEISNVLDKVEIKLSTSEIYTEDLNYKIYISSDFKPYAIFCPSLKDAFAATYPVINNIFISKTEIENNIVRRNSSNDNERSLSSVITHEVTHKLIENKIGAKGNKKLETWKKEGYCEYISVETTLDLKTGINEIYQGSNQFLPDFDYLKYRILVTYLMDVKGHTFQNLIETEFDMNNLQEELINYKNSNY